MPTDLPDDWTGIRGPQGKPEPELPPSSGGENWTGLLGFIAVLIFLGWIAYLILR